MAPADGKILPMEQARDEAFASCAMGNGIVVLPSDGEVTAPCNGTITTIWNHPFTQSVLRRRTELTF